MKPNYIQTILNAAGCPDPAEALDMLTGFLAQKGMSGSNGFPRPQTRHHQLLLAGVLARNGRLSDACLVLGEEPGAPARATAEAIIIEPGFLHMEGHHYNTNLFYRRLLDAAGLSSQVLRARMAHDSFEHDEIGSIPTFVMSPYEGIFRQPLNAEELAAVNQLFEFEFKRKLPSRRPRLAIAHSCRHTFVDGVCAYFESCDPAERSTLLMGIIEADTFDPSHVMHEAVLDVYRRAFERLASIEGLRTLLVADTEEIAEKLADLGNHKLDVCVTPHVAGFLSEARTERRHGANAKPVVGYVGQTRPERGPHLLPEIASRTLDRLGDTHLWRAQVDVPRIRNFMPDGSADLLERLVSAGSFEIAGTNMSAADYFGLLQAMDIVVMPYSARYQTTGSGVAVECISMGCVLVVPEGSSMERLARSQGAGVITFPDASPQAVADAVCDALTGLDALKAKSIAAAARQNDRATLDVTTFVNSA